MCKNDSLDYSIKKIATIRYLKSNDISYLKIADEIGSWGQLRTWYRGNYSVLSHAENEVVFQPIDIGDKNER